MAHSHTHPPAMPDDHDPRYATIRRVTLIGSLVDFLLGVAKIAVGYVYHSQALIADGIHSLSDLATDFMVIYAARHASQAADEEHPYGQARIETVMTVGLGAALIIVAIGIAWDAVSRLFEPERLLHPGILAVVVAAISILAKEAIYHYTMHAAKKLRSRLLRANAWHSRSDAISSIIVFVGVLGAMAGLDYLDAIAAVGVAIMIVKIGWELAWHSIRELIDTALDAERVQHIHKTIEDVPGVVDLHMLRTRRMGADALVDVHIQVEPKLSVSEGHQISELVRRKLIDEIEEVTDVMVHIDPEDDERATPCCELPDRDQVIARLRELWQAEARARDIQDITLHYLDGHIEVEACLPLAVVDSPEAARELAGRLAGLAESDPVISRARIGFS
ncbi:MAG: cation diffusion facilitator family transporter [Granulosicoccaceae bacterium]